MDEANPMYDRLKLTRERIEGIAGDTRNVAALPSPLGRVLKHTVLPNGLDLKRVSVPFGVIGIVYEARPNVTFDVFALCLKAGSACILKGGKDADDSNRAIVGIIKSVLREHKVNENAINLLPASHEATAELLHANGIVDLVIPRGSKRLIDFVRREASVPVIETGAGVCHAYFDKDGRGHKAFLLPQEDPEQNLRLTKSYNVPELTRDAVRTTAKQLKECIYRDEDTQKVKYVK